MLGGVTLCNSRSQLQPERHTTTKKTTICDGKVVELDGGVSASMFSGRRVSTQKCGKSEGDERVKQEVKEEGKRGRERKWEKCR